MPTPRRPLGQRLPSNVRLTGGNAPRGTFADADDQYPPIAIRKSADVFANGLAALPALLAGRNAPVLILKILSFIGILVNKLAKLIRGDGISL
jgi:hypothetical protein